MLQALRSKSYLLVGIGNDEASVGKITTAPSHDRFSLEHRETIRLVRTKRI
jgi:hypothetical protein